MSSKNLTDKQIFKNGSTTYYWSSMFFPTAVRDDVFKLYSFVRVADNYVDAMPQDKKGFERFEKLWHWAETGKPSAGKSVDARVVRNMHEISQKYDFDPNWTKAFMRAMHTDLRPKIYKTMDDTIDYMYGSAEVVGLMMSKIFGLPDSSFEAARYQGRAMQYINFIRDIAEDTERGRCYFPKSELVKYGLPRLDQKTAYTYPAAYREFIEAQLVYYRQWQAQAREGFHVIPFSMRVALKTAVDMYDWTARKIADDPFVVFEKKVKPSKFRVIGRAVRRTLSG